MCGVSALSYPDAMADTPRPTPTFGIVGGVITKRGGLLVSNRTRAYGKPFEYPWGERQPRESLEQIVCSDCGKVIAQDITWEAAKDLAIEAKQAYFESESDTWLCDDNCYQNAMREHYAEAAQYGREMELRAMMEEERDAIDSMLDAGDLHRKGIKENGW